MSIILTVIGVFLLLVCAAGVALGVYMASDARSREPGVLFALCWVSGAAGAAGVSIVTLQFGLGLALDVKNDTTAFFVNYGLFAANDLDEQWRHRARPHRRSP